MTPRPLLCGFLLRNRICIWKSWKCKHLVQVPNKLGRLTGLRELSFQHKLVKSIPEPVLQLTALEALAITFCKLQRLPATLGAMHRLRSLNLQGNPWLQVRLPMPALCMWGSSGQPLCLLSAWLGSHMAGVDGLLPTALCYTAVTGKAIPCDIYIIGGATAHGALS